MKNNFFVVAACTVLSGGTLYASLPSAESILGWQQEEGKELIYGTGFENPAASEIKLGAGFRYAHGEGNNGNTGLRVDRTGEIHRTQDSFIRLPDKILPGYKYKVVVSVKGRGIRHATRPVPPGSYRFMETFYTDAHTGRYSFENERVVPFAKPPAEDGFQEFSYTFPGIEGARASLRLALWIDFHGTLWFDDLRVYREGVEANAFLIQPGCATFFTDSGKFRIRIHLPEEYGKPVGLVQLVMNGTVLQRRVIAAADSWLEGDFGRDLPAGNAVLKITLADARKKQRIKDIELPVTVRKTEKAPAGAVAFDRHGNMSIDGKPVLPLGIFYGSLPHQREENLRKLADSPFNFIVDYSALSMALPQDREKITAIRKGLDRMQHYKIKSLFCLTAFYSANSNYVKRGWAGEKDTLSMTRKLAEAIKDHPALLGWYLTDELSEEQLALPVAMRNLLNRLDPYHPTFTLTNLPSAMPGYAVSGDVLMYDPYPLDNRNRGRGGVERAIKPFRVKAAAAGCPVWAVTQGFNWGIMHIIHRGGKEKLADYIEPTEEDMRSMALLSAIEGARGFCFFNFPFPWEQKVLDRFAAQGMSDYPEKMWRKLKGAAGAVKSLEPYLLSRKKAPEIHVENRGKANTRARAWQAENGKICLVVAGVGGGRSEAVITVPGKENLKSVYGRTIPLGGGRYQYTSDDLGSDILFE